MGTPLAPGASQSKDSMSLSDVEQFILYCCTEGIKTPEHLHLFLELISGYRVPFTPVCDNHKSPWHYIAPLYFEVVRDVIVVATRTGGKTLSTAQLNAAELLTKPTVEICSVGAIEGQAKKCYKYTRRFLLEDRIARQFVGSSLMSDTQMVNGASYQQIIGTVSGVNSPHPHKLRADEVELMKPDVVEEMKMVPHSTSKIRASFSAVSSRKYLYGNMQELLKQAKDGGYDAIVEWCYKEISERCPVERRGKKPRIYETPKLSNPAQFVKFTAWEDCGPCPLLPTCRGDLAYATGFNLIDDSIKEFRRLDRKTWIAQKECGTPSSSGLVYGEYIDHMPQVGSYPFNPNLPTYCCNDFGFTDPWVNLWIQKKDNGEDEEPDWFVVHEHYETHKQAEEHHAVIKQWNLEKGALPILHAVDNANPSEIERMMDAGFDVEPVPKGKIPHSLPFIRKRLLSADGKRHLFIDKSCVHLRAEFRRYHFPEGGGEVPADEFNHCLDALRYFFMWFEEQNDPVIT